MLIVCDYRHRLRPASRIFRERGDSSPIRRNVKSDDSKFRKRLDKISGLEHQVGFQNILVTTQHGRPRVKRNVGTKIRHNRDQPVAGSSIAEFRWPPPKFAANKDEQYH